jgi:hypothetical protein
MIKDPKLKKEYSYLKHHGYKDGYPSEYIEQRLAEIIAEDIIGKAQSKRSIAPPSLRAFYHHWKSNAGNT